MNLDTEYERIVDFIQNVNRLLKSDGVVVGISGGIDSAICAKLSVDALGKDKCIGIAMPSDDSDPKDLEDAKMLTSILDIRLEIFPVSLLLDIFSIPRWNFEKEVKPFMLEPTKLLPSQMQLLYTMKLRGRAYILSYFAGINNYLQCQTLQKTEWLLGWLDKFGDAAGDFAPIFHLYKTQVRELAKYIDLPDFILNRAPTSGNFPMTDEECIGMTIEEADRILFYLEKQLSMVDISKLTGINQDKIVRISEVVKVGKLFTMIPITIDSTLESKPIHQEARSKIC